MTTKERYTVGDDVCGFVSSHGCRADAMEAARLHLNAAHAGAAGDAFLIATVYDRMARTGMRRLWHFGLSGRGFAAQVPSDCGRPHPTSNCLCVSCANVRGRE